MFNIVKETIQQINNDYNGNLQFKNENIDSLDLIESQKCSEKCSQQYEFCVGCPNCRLSNVESLKYYVKTKLEDVKGQQGYKSHFQTPCFCCSSSFHCSNFEDGHFNLQKMFEVEKKCVTCQRNFTTERSFCHKCNICYASFNNCQLLVHHRKRKHNLKKPYQCFICRQSLSKSKGLARHIAYKHKHPHKCQYCGKRYATKMNLKLHTLVHNGEKPFLCKYCPKQYRTKRNFDIHQFEHTGGKQFKCDLCDKTFATRCKLKQHKRVVHLEKSFQCEYCSRQYKTKQGLDYHLFKHTGDKQFKCDLCSKTFATKWSFNRHKIGHMERLIQCKYCPKQYKSKQGFDYHLLEHIRGEKLTELVDKTLATKSKLEKQTCS